MSGNSTSKLIGSALIIVGTCIGAGMLVLPLVTAAIGFTLSILLLIFVAFLMLATALLIVEVNLHFPEGTHFGRMSEQTLGLVGKAVTWVSFLLLLYALTAAYTSQASTLLSLWLGDIGVNLPTWGNGLLYILVLGSFVYMGTGAVDGLNKFLISIKGLVFFALAVVLSPHISTHDLFRSTTNINYIWYAFPLLITAFGYHVVLPSLRTYLNSDPKALRRAVVVGALTPLVIYLIWEVVTLGTIPLHGEHSFKFIANHGGSATELVETYQARFHSDWIETFAAIFTNVAVLTSFLGVSLSLFSFNQDSFGLNKNKAKHKVPVYFLTYLPPFIFAVCYPDGFVMALGYASIFVAILLIILPAMMAWKVRSEKGRNSNRSKAYLILIMLLGVGFIVLQFMSDAGKLPVFH